MHPRPGDVWLADLGIAGKTRPVVIVSRHDPASPRVLCIYIPLTTQDRGSNYEVPVTANFLRETSVANVQGIASVAIARLERRIGVVPDSTLQEIRRALKFALELD
jgi:mRNA interferase MazF